ncbi:50S ribosomal protein L13 [Candidatus Pacearchaeota archaeon]|nr:50S ribosomal protein L13 [Candidatus Pacearchaeota archaeon]
MAKIIIDGEGTILGRLASYAAKQALQGNEIIILNSEKIIISGDRKQIIDKYMTIRKKGGKSRKGPKHSKISYLIVKKAIRGMVKNYRWGEGREAFKRVMCYEGVPSEFEKEKKTKIKTNKPLRFIEIKTLSEAL